MSSLWGVATPALQTALLAKLHHHKCTALIYGVVSKCAVVGFSSPQALTYKRLRTYGIEHALWKLPITEYQVAQRVLAVAPPGPMLAPENIASDMLLTSTAYPQLAIRAEAELYWGYLEKNLKQMTARVETAGFFDG